MNRALLTTSLLAATLLSLTLSARAQSPTPTLTFSPSDALVAANAYTQQPATTVHLLAGTVGGCPVGLTAGHSAGLTAFKAADQKPGEVSQSLHLRMSNPGASGIRSAQITVYGLTPRGRVTSVAGGRAQDATTSRHVALNLSVDARRSAATDLRVVGFTSIQRIDLDSIAYADGTTWTASAQQPCSVVPSRLMLVAAQ